MVRHTFTRNPESGRVEFSARELRRFAKNIAPLQDRLTCSAEVKTAAAKALDKLAYEAMVLIGTRDYYTAMRFVAERNPELMNIALGSPAPDSKAHVTVEEDDSDE